MVLQCWRLSKVSVLLWIGGENVQPVILNDEQLQAKCEEWQKILRLQDWIVDLKISRERDFVTKDANAEISLNEQHKLAFVKILDPVDFDEDQFSPQDMEKSLVHELLRIHFWPLRESDANETAEEQAINMIAGALVDLYRRGGEAKIADELDMRRNGGAEG